LFHASRSRSARAFVLQLFDADAGIIVTQAERDGLFHQNRDGFCPCSRRQLFAAVIISLKTLRRAVSCESAPFMRTYDAGSPRRRSQSGSMCADASNARREDRRTSAAPVVEEANPEINCRSVSNAIPLGCRIDLL
jgi:hypothetical protein